MKILSPIKNYFKIIDVPTSKSEVQRLIAIASLYKYETKINNVVFCDDILDAVNIAKQFGANIIFRENSIIVKGNLSCKNNLIKIEESGLSLRIFITFSLFFDEPITFDGNKFLRKRKIKSVYKFFSKYAKLYSTNNDFLPITVSGKLISDNIIIDASETSQFLSGLLITLPHINPKIKINVSNLKSYPYISLTKNYMKKFGWEVSSSFGFKKKFDYKGKTFNPSGDWSNASFFIVAAAISGSVVLKNLDINSFQGDKIILELIKSIGAKVIVNNNFILVKKYRLNNFNFDATNYPDLFPPLIILAAVCPGFSVIKGVHRLKNKESDRIYSLTKLMHSLNIKYKIADDSFVIYNSKISGGKVKTFNDHRIVMTGTLASVVSIKDIILDDISFVNKSYPNFFKDFL